MWGYGTVVKEPGCYRTEHPNSNSNVMTLFPPAPQFQQLHAASDLPSPCSLDFLWICNQGPLLGFADLASSSSLLRASLPHSKTLLCALTKKSIQELSSDVALVEQEQKELRKSSSQ